MVLVSGQSPGAGSTVKQMIQQQQHKVVIQAGGGADPRTSHQEAEDCWYVQQYGSYTGTSNCLPPLPHTQSAML